MLAFNTNINDYQFSFPIVHFITLPTLPDSIQGDTV